LDEPRRALSAAAHIVVSYAASKTSEAKAFQRSRGTFEYPHQ